MINAISHQLAKAFSEFIDRKNEVDYIRYGIEIILNGMIKLLVLLGIAYLVGLFQPMIWVFFTFVIFRCLTGGHHYSTYFRCLIVGLMMMLGISYVATRLGIIFDYASLVAFLIFTVIFGSILTYKYAPSNHFYKKCNENQKKMLRKYAFFFILIWFFFLYFLISISFTTELILASIIGFLFQMLSIHPYSYVFVSFVENFFERRNVQ